jgi:hypothetical protein
MASRPSSGKGEERKSLLVETNADASPGTPLSSKSHQNQKWVVAGPLSPAHQTDHRLTPPSSRERDDLTSLNGRAGSHASGATDIELGRYTGDTHGGGGGGGGGGGYTKVAAAAAGGGGVGGCDAVEGGGGSEGEVVTPLTDEDDPRIAKAMIASMVVNLVLAAVKLYAAIFSGSMAIVASLVDR